MQMMVEELSKQFQRPHWRIQWHPSLVPSSQRQWNQRKTLVVATLSSWTRPSAPTGRSSPARVRLPDQEEPMLELCWHPPVEMTKPVALLQVGLP